MLVALLGAAPAQDPPPLRERALDMLHKTLRNQGAYRTLQGLVRHAPKRLAGSPGAAAAVEWARQQMTSIGLADVRLEEVVTNRWVRGTVCRVTALVGGAEIPLAATALGGSIRTPQGGLEARVIEVKTFGKLRAIKETARGAIILFNRPWDPTLRNAFTSYSRVVNQRSRGAIEASKAGGVAALVRSVTSMPDDVPHTGHMGYADGTAKVPAAAISVVAADRLKVLLDRHGDALRVRIEMDCGMREPVRSANVVGEIKGRELPDEVVLIAAHLDAWDLAQGAQDDGAGVAHCLEAMRLIKSSGRPPRRTVRVCLYMDEENGLAGGLAYAAQHAGELAKHVLAIETDSGGAAPHGFGVSGGKKMVTALEPVSALLSRYDLGKIVQGGGGADISPLGPSGVPLMSLRSADHRYFDVHHSAKDTIEQVHPRELSLGAGALAICAFAVADSAGTLPRANQ